MPPALLSGVVAALVLSIAGVAAGQSVSFQGDIDGAVQVATVEEVAYAGVPHVSIVSLTEQLGGSATVLATRARLELAGSTAWIQADDNRVNAFRIFSLSGPVIRTEDHYWIATADVPTFFEKAFRVAVAPGSLSMPEAPLDVAEPTVEPQPEAESAEPDAVSAPPTQVIVIDPGHGGFESGIEGTGGLAEKTLVLDVAGKVKAELESRVNQRVVLTREEDLALNETQRAAIVQNSDADVVVSLHAGSSLSPSVRGFTVLYESGNRRIHGRPLAAREDARRLAGLVTTSLKEVADIPFRGLDAAEMRLLGQPGISGVMIELGCLTNAQDEAALNNEATRAVVAKAISTGILRFLGIQPEPDAGESAE